MAIPVELRYTKDHEWARLEGSTVTVGITEFAGQQLGDVVYVEFQPVGTTVTQHAPFGNIESTKSVSELMAPVSGTITAGNEGVVDDPAAVNRDPYGAGWIISIAASAAGELDELM